MSAVKFALFIEGIIAHHRTVPFFFFFEVAGWKTKTVHAIVFSDNNGDAVDFIVVEEPETSVCC